MCYNGVIGVGRARLSQFWFYLGDLKMSNNNRKVYKDHVTESSKPIKDRSAVITGRSGALCPRRHHLIESDQNKYIKLSEDKGRLHCPYKNYGAYYGVVESLSRLGENESHLLGSVIIEFEKYMSEESSIKKGRTAWERFRDRQTRSVKSGLDHMGRIQQNIQVLQRLGGDHPYGLKLAQLGCCIDILQGEKGQQLIRLRTGIPAGEPIMPVNDFKSRKCFTSVKSVPSMICFRAGT